MRFSFDSSNLRTGLALVAILCLALAARLAGTGWDGFAALHPDERHLFLLTQDMFAAWRDAAHTGLSWRDWWLSSASPLNPHGGEGFYVYGELPLLAGFLAGLASGDTDWFGFIPLARMLSALLDTSSVFWVFLAARMLAGNGAALAAAALYAAMPTALQLANFHTVDVWLTAAVAMTMVPMIALVRGGGGRMRRLARAAAMGAGIGLAMASKITGLLLLPVGLAALWGARRSGLKGRHLPGLAAVAGIAMLAVFRLANPFAFEGGGGLAGLRLSQAWIGDFAQLARLTAAPDFPPNWSWDAGYGGLRLLRDFALFGAGPVATLLLAGLLAGPLAGLAPSRAKPAPAKRPAPATAPAGRRAAGLIPLALLAGFLLLTMLSKVSALRYGAPGLAALAVTLAPLFARLPPARATLPALLVACWWGSGAVILHDGQHPRLAASLWLWRLPEGTRLLNETAWDEALPTIVPLGPGGAFRWPDHGGHFRLDSLDITSPDTPEKADRIAARLARADYLILSSDRQSGVLPRLPARFPMSAAHYAALFGGRACFEPRLEIDRGYPLPFLPFDDGWAQEPWRIYDHPPVRIFARLPCYDAARYAAFLKAALAESGAER